MPAKLEDMPQQGEKAPDFMLATHLGGDIRLRDLQGKYVVLYFYPRDSTPGCTVEANEFQDHSKAFSAANAIVLGVSTDSLKKHCSFAEKQGLNFDLLADTEHEICDVYGVWTEKVMAGKRYMGIQRATFLIDPEGKIVQVWPKVKPVGHAEEVLARINA